MIRLKYRVTFIILADSGKSRYSLSVKQLCYSGGNFFIHVNENTKFRQWKFVIIMECRPIALKYVFTVDQWFSTIFEQTPP